MKSPKIIAVTLQQIAAGQAALERDGHVVAPEVVIQVYAAMQGAAPKPKARKKR